MVQRRRAATPARARHGETGPMKPEKPSVPAPRLLRPCVFPCPMSRAEVLAHVEHEIEASGDRSLILRGAHHQFTAEEAVLAVLRLAREIELCREQASPRWRDLHMEMARAALVAARNDGAKAVAPLRVGALVSAQTKA